MKTTLNVLVSEGIVECIPLYYYGSSKGIPHRLFAFFVSLINVFHYFQVAIRYTGY